MFFPRTRKFNTKNSSVIETIYYMSTLKEQTLFTKFNNGQIYSYDNVPYSVFKTLKKTNKKNNSVGSEFNSLVKNGGYEYKRLTVS